MNKTLLLLLTGFVAGILLAPRKGSETWEMVLDKIDEMKGEVTDEAEDVAEQAADLGDSLKRKGKKMARDIHDDTYGTQL